MDHTKGARARSCICSCRQSSDVSSRMQHVDRARRSSEDPVAKLNSTHRGCGDVLLW